MGISSERLPGNCMHVTSCGWRNSRAEEARGVSFEISTHFWSGYLVPDLTRFYVNKLQQQLRQRAGRLRDEFKQNLFDEEFQFGEDWWLQRSNWMTWICGSSLGDVFLGASLVAWRKEQYSFTMFSGRLRSSLHFQNQESKFLRFKASKYSLLQCSWQEKLQL